MDTIRRVILSAWKFNTPKPLSGANLSTTKLGHERQSSTRSSMPIASQASHLLHQLGAAGLVALLALGGMFITLELAGTSNLKAAFSIQTSGQNENASQENAGQEDEKKSESKQEKKPAVNQNVKNIKELEVPSPLISELMRGTRPHRDPVPELLIEKSLLPDAPKPTPEDNRKFGEFKKLGGPDIRTDADKALIERVVKYQVYSLTDPNWFRPNPEARKPALEEMRKNRDAIESIFEAKGGVNEKFLAIYKPLAQKYLADLLDNHLWVRANAMRLLAMLKDEETIRLFVAQIDDPKQHEGIKFLAIEGIESLGQKNLIGKVELQSMAVNTLLNLLKKGEQIHPSTRQSAVRALGAMGRPTRVIGRNDAEVAVALLKILRDPNIRRWDRNEAAVLLANLQIPPELDYNFQYVAYEIAQFAADVAAAALKDPSIDDLHSHLFLVDASYALAPEKKTPRMLPLAESASAKKHAKAAGHGDPAYIRTIGERVNRLTVAALKAYKPEAAAATKPAAQPKAEDVVKKTQEIAARLQGDFAKELDALNDLLKNKPPRSPRLTPETDELGPPPALVGPNAPLSNEGQENGKEKPGDKAAASTNPPGQ